MIFICRGEGGKEPFRHWYGKLAELRAFFSVPFLALTATATTEMQEKIQESLNLSQPFVLASIPNKENIKYIVVNVNTDDPAQIFSKYVDDLKEKEYKAERVIIFCRTMSILRAMYAFVDDSFTHYITYLDKPYARFHSRTSEVKSKKCFDV